MILIINMFQIILLFINIYQKVYSKKLIKFFQKKFNHIGQNKKKDIMDM